MTSLIFDNVSLRQRVMDLTNQTRIADLIMVRLLYKLKMAHFPDVTHVLTAEGSNPPVAGAHRCADTLDTIRNGNVDLPDTILFSCDPRTLALSAYTLQTYTIDNNLLELKPLTFNSLKRTQGHDPRDVDYFAQHLAPGQPPERGDKTRAGQWRKKAWAWAEEDYDGTCSLSKVVDNVHVLVGRTGFQNYEICQDMDSLLRLLDKVHEIGWDTETTGLDWRTDHVVGESLSIDGEHGIYVPFLHKETGRLHNLSWSEAVDRLHPLIQSKGLRGANLGFDVLMARLDFPRNLHDIQGYGWMLGMHVPSPKALGLKAMTKAILGDVMEEYEHVAQGGTFDEVPIDRAAPYAADDAVKSYRLIDALAEKMTAGQLERWRTIEMPFLRTVIRMTHNGMHMDLAAHAPIMQGMSDDILRIKDRIYQHAGVEFDLNSPMQMQDILFKRLGLPPTKRTKTGHSTDVESLSAIEHLHPIIALVLQFRELDKLMNTYVSKYPAFVGIDGRIHSHWNAFKVVTGRLSSSDPNLMNIPRRTELGRELRKLFAGQGDNYLLSCDAGQLEYRLLAHYSQAPLLLEAFNDASRDIHREMAATVFDIPLERVTNEHRELAKRVAYAIIYGAGPLRIAAVLSTSIANATRILNTISRNFPEIDRLRAVVVEQARRLGYVETDLGHRSYIWGLNSHDSRVRGQAERSAFDSLFQGTASGDVTKLATIHVQNIIEQHYPGALLVGQIHDEILIEGSRELLESMKHDVEYGFTDLTSFRVPLTAEAKIGKRWFDCK